MRSAREYGWQRIKQNLVALFGCERSHNADHAPRTATLRWTKAGLVHAVVDIRRALGFKSFLVDQILSVCGGHAYDSRSRAHQYALRATESPTRCAGAGRMNRAHS